MFNFPYTNFHRLNLDWIVSKIEQIERGDYTPVNFQIANVRDYGAVGNGIEDDTAAITTAANSGLPVYFPVGMYNISRPITPSTEGQMFFGAGWGSIIIYSGSSAFDCNSIPKVYITNLEIHEDDPHRAAGWTIANMRGQYSGVHRVRILAYNGIEHGANSGIVSDCEIRCVGDGIKIYNGDNTETIENCIIASYDFAETPDNGNGIVVESGACANLKNVSTILKNNGVKFTGTFTSFNAIQCWFDNCKDGFNFATGSQINRTRVNNCWFASREADAKIAGGISGLWFDNCEFYKAGLRAILGEATANIENINITNCLFCKGEGPAAIDFYASNASNILVNNNNFTPYDGGGNYSTGISVGGSTSGIITGNCMKGVTTPIFGQNENVTFTNNYV